MGLFLLDKGQVLAMIDIRRKHSLSREQARARADELASNIKNSFELDYHWEGESLYFERTGVDGVLEVLDAEIRITIQLSWLMRPIKGRLEEEIRRYMDVLLA